MNNGDFKQELLSDPILFAKYFFKYEYNKEFYPAEHHIKIAEKLKDVLTLKTTRLIINIAPRFGKTELVVKMFMAMGLAFNPKSKFIHTSYSEKLALDNSEAVRDIVKSKPYQEIFDIKTKKDSDSKSKWYTQDGGGVYATSTGGQITGFGAGSIDSPYFSGALIIDDPIKPESALSFVTRDFANQRFDNTLRSRLNSEKTPIIIIMQRLHPDDLTGYLLEKEPEKWEQLILPALKEDGTALWEQKLSAKDLMHFRKISPYVFYSQYQQAPQNVQIGGEFLRNFDLNKHVGNFDIDANRQIHISIDANVLPYVAVSFWQVYKENSTFSAVQVHEIPCTYPDNSAFNAGRKIGRYLNGIGYKMPVKLYGDSTTKNRSAITEQNKSFYDLFVKGLLEQNYNIEDQFFKSNPIVSQTGTFINDALGGLFKHIEIGISEKCTNSIQDYSESKEDLNGSILKVKVKNNKGQSYEKNGHFLDNMRGFLCKIFEKDFKQYKKNASFGFTGSEFNRFEKNY